MHSPSLRSSVYAFVVTAGLGAAGAACGSVPQDRPAADAAALDAVVAPDAAAPPDAAPPAPRCDPSKPFGAPTRVPGINSAKRDQGAVLVDELTLYFGSDRGPTTGLYKATRSSPTAPFTTPVPLTEINATGAASGPSATADGLTMYYALVAPSQTTGDLYVTSRQAGAADFPAGTKVAQLNSTVDDLDPFITADGTALYFDSARTAGAIALDLYVAVRRADGAFDTPQPLTDLNTSVADGHPVLTRDGRTLYWSSARSDGGAAGGTDIWMATRPTTAGSFGAPTRVPELSSPSNESLSWISADGCVAYLQSDRADGVPNQSQDIFVAVRPM